MAVTLTKTFTVDGVATDVTSCVLSNSAATAGVIRTDTDAVVVADGTAMTKISTGQYSYSFDEPASGLTYEVYFEWIFGGETYRETQTYVASDTEALNADYDNLRRSIGRFLGYDRAPASWTADQIQDVADIIRSGLSRVLTPPPLPGERYGHEWSFMRPKTTMTLSAPYSTGTVTVASGVVTLASGTAPSWTAGAQMAVSGANYTVSTRDGDTQWTLTDTTVTVAAGTSYELSRTTYDLPTDFAMFEGELTYDPGTNVGYVPIHQRSEGEVRAALANLVWTARPEIFAIRPKALSASTGTRYEIQFYPASDAAYVLQYRYRVNPDTLSGSNQYPFGGPPMHEVYLESCLSAAEAHLNDEEAVHSKRFWPALAAAVSYDRRNASPPNLGYNRDRSDRPIEYDETYHDFQERLVTLNGISP